MRSSLFAAVSALATMVSVTALAGQMSPGLWEITTKSDGMRAMPQIPPEQMERMRQMGVQMPQMNQNGMVTKACITAAQAQADTPPMGDRRGQSDCKPANVQHSGDSYSMDLVCDGPNMKGTGHLQGSFSGGTAFTQTYDFTGTAQGHPMNNHTQTSGRWLSADCGGVQ